MIQHASTSSGMCTCAVACTASALTFNASASMIEFTDQFNWLIAEIGEAGESITNDEVGPFNDSITIKSPHPDADLIVNSQQSRSLFSDLVPGAPVVSFKGDVSVSGSDFFDDGAGGLFEVSAITQTRLTFTLDLRTRFDVAAAATTTLIGGFADLVLIDMDGDPFEPLLHVGTNAEEEVRDILVLEQGTYLIDAWSDFHFLGPGAWDGEAGYDFAMSVVPAPGSVLLLITAAGVAGLQTRRRR